MRRAPSGEARQAAWIPARAACASSGGGARERMRTGLESSWQGEGGPSAVVRGSPARQGGDRRYPRVRGAAQRTPAMRAPRPRASEAVVIYSLFLFWAGRAYVFGTWGKGAAARCCRRGSPRGAVRSRCCAAARATSRRTVYVLGARALRVRSGGRARGNPTPAAFCCAYLTRGRLPEREARARRTARGTWCARAAASGRVCFAHPRA